MRNWFRESYPHMIDSFREMHETSHAKSLFSPMLNDYHEEGDVYTHTMMVYQNAVRNDLHLPTEIADSDGVDGFNDSQADVMALAALFHDIGKAKVRTYDEKKDRVYFINHENVGPFYAYGILKKMGISNPAIEEIMYLINYHQEFGKMVHFGKAEGNADDIAKRLVDKHGLYYAKMITALFIYDWMGRISTDTTANNQSYVLARDVYTSIADYGEYGDATNRPGVQWHISSANLNFGDIYLMVGVPGSGKSTWIKNRMEKWKRGIVVSRDAIIEEFDPSSTYSENRKRVDQTAVDKEFNRRLNDALQSSRGPVYVDKTHMGVKAREAILKHTKERYVRCVMMWEDLDTIYARIRDRAGKIIEPSVVQNMMKNFAMPTQSEGFSQIIHRMGEK